MQLFLIRQGDFENHYLTDKELAECQEVRGTLKYQVDRNALIITSPHRMADGTADALFVLGDKEMERNFSDSASPAETKLALKAHLQRAVRDNHSCVVVVAGETAINNLVGDFIERVATNSVGFYAHRPPLGVLRIHLAEPELSFDHIQRMSHSVLKWDRSHSWHHTVELVTRAVYNNRSNPVSTANEASSAGQAGMVRRKIPTL